MQDVLFVVSKILRPMFTSPLFLCLLASTVALLALKAHSRTVRILKIVALSMIAITTILSTPLTVNCIAALWEYPLSDIDTVVSRGRYDVAIILGGSLEPASSRHGRLEGNDSFERLSSAAVLYKEGVVARLIFTGGSGSLTWPDRKEAPFALEFLSLMGVPSQAVIFEDQSRNSFENAIFTRSIAEKQFPSIVINAKSGDLDAHSHNHGKALLVTSAWHMRRSAAIFSKAGFRFEPLSVDSLITPLQIPKDFFPDAWALERSTRILIEIIGYIAYRILGRL
ncbi:MAG: YdcF family protein [Rectinema sp.]|nr:YdcF family protein [Rectinema sp.]